MIKIIIRIIDSFYFLFQRFIPLKTYRYGVCGGSNLVFDTFLYFVFYNFIFSKQNVDMGFFVLSPHIASLFFVFPITFLTGFILSRYITFQNSTLSVKAQFFRYFIVGIGAILLSYCAMKFLVDFLKLYPTPSRLITIVITVIYSYTLQNRFSFRV
ncbi:GtrA family protein [Aquimarina sp. AD1]|uniref:GtrA family protein n=1 Tax=Aquimarina sp. (strain AD1) TaxID=1714848 RepID=UPI000E4DCCAF|nr:GtrA family protein [Aquimarina sp. AD1]RKN19242.1 GtrA family protein [Aquimarina sp. AD1]